MVETSSRIWHKLFIENDVPRDGIIIEIAPGYEPKIGNALALFGFTGNIFLIEPDAKAAFHIGKTYTRILPKAKVKIVCKTMQELEIEADIPAEIDTIVASHPFDDMVIGHIVKDPDFFSKEKDTSAKGQSAIKRLYDSLQDSDYRKGIRVTVSAWKDLISRAAPKLVIVSQYPSATLFLRGLTKRQNSGFAVLKKLKSFYKSFLIENDYENLLGPKGASKWWMVVKRPQYPRAIKRLGRSIFIPQQARQLGPTEYDIVYVDDKQAQNANDFALIIDDKKPPSQKNTLVYADRQKDKTDIGLSGNLGSGRAEYFPIPKLHPKHITSFC